MDRRLIIKNVGIAGVLAAGLAACGKKDEVAAPAASTPAAPAAPAVGSGVVRWRLASSFPKSLDTIYGAAEVMSKAVKAMSGGKFEISVHAGGELMPAFGVVDGVQNGTDEMTHSAP